MSPNVCIVGISPFKFEFLEHVTWNYDNKLTAVFQIFFSDFNISVLSVIIKSEALVS